MIRRAVAITISAALLAASSPAFADEPTSGPPSAPESSDGAAAKRRIFIYTGYGVAAVGLGLSFVFLAQANSAYNGRLDIARANGSESHTAWKCYGADECGRMNGFREDQAAAKQRWAAMMGLTIGGAVTGTVFLIAHLLDSPNADSKRATRPQLSPEVSPQQAGLRVQGTF